MEKITYEVKETDHRFDPRVEQVDGGFKASFNFRDLVFFGETERAAIANAVYSLCQLVRQGAIDPDLPDAPGAPPIQHALDVLGDTLVKRVADRNRNREFMYENDMKSDDANSTTNTRPGRIADGSPTWGSSYAKSPTFTRDNEVISGLATAIAALARVKEL